MIFKVILVTDVWDILWITRRWMTLNLTDARSILVQVMAWCRQATNHYLSQCWPRSASPYGVTKPQWVNAFRAKQNGRHFAGEIQMRFHERKLLGLGSGATETWSLTICQSRVRWWLSADQERKIHICTVFFRRGWQNEFISGVNSVTWTDIKQRKSSVPEGIQS